MSVITIKKLIELPPTAMRFFSTQAEAEKDAAERGQDVYYFQENHTWYVPEAKL